MKKYALVPSVLYRVLENVFNNAMRYAKQCINLDVSLMVEKLLFAIVDDGDGFSDETLSEQRKLLAKLRRMVIWVWDLR